MLFLRARAFTAALARLAVAACGRIGSPVCGSYLLSCQFENVASGVGASETLTLATSVRPTPMRSNGAGERDEPFGRHGTSLGRHVDRTLVVRRETELVNDGPHPLRPDPALDERAELIGGEALE